LRVRLAVPPAKKKATALAQVMVDHIVSNGLQPGDRLPPESEMVELYGVGRGTLRETLRLLEAQGVVVIRPGPGGGPVVAPLTGEPMAANMALFLERAGGTFGSVMEVRRTIEPEIAALVAERQDPDILRDLRNSVNSDRASLNGTPRLVGVAANFHDFVARSTGNPAFEAILVALHRMTEPFAQRLRYDDARRSELLHSHDRIVRAIERGDPGAARNAMTTDLDDFMRHVETTAPNMLEELITWEVVEP